MKRLLLLFGLVIPLAFLAISCGFPRTTLLISNGPGPNVAVYHYWYYPAYGVYYDHVHRVYFYREGDEWRHADRLPVRYRALGSHVVIETSHERPYMDYGRHRAQYPPPDMRRDDRRREDGRGDQGGWDNGRGNDGRDRRDRGDDHGD